MTHTLTMAGLDPATQCTASAVQRLFPARGRALLGGRLKGGHGEWGWHDA